MLSYLPLAHIFQRVAEFAFIGVGGSIGYYSGVGFSFLLAVLRGVASSAHPETQHSNLPLFVNETRTLAEPPHPAG